MALNQMPQEIEVWYVLPAIRRELAKQMAVLGLKQKEMAALLGITESAVSQYIKSKRAKQIEFDEEAKEAIKDAAKRIKEDGGCLIPEMQRICILLRNNRTICRLHMKLSKVPLKCKACVGGLQ